MEKQSTLGDRASDFFSKLVRSWGFVMCQAALIVAWVVANTTVYHFDPYPFDCLKLILITEISFIGSIVLMNQYRQSSIDRKITYKDFLINWVAKKEVDQMLPLIKADHLKMLEVLDILKKDKPTVDKIDT